MKAESFTRDKRCLLPVWTREQGGGRHIEKLQHSKWHTVGWGDQRRSAEFYKKLNLLSCIYSVSSFFICQVFSQVRLIRLPSSAVYPHKGRAFYHVSLHAHLSLAPPHSQLSLPSSATWCSSTYCSLHESGSASLSSNTCCRDQPLACQMMLRVALPCLIPLPVFLSPSLSLSSHACIHASAAV